LDLVEIKKNVDGPHKAGHDGLSERVRQSLPRPAGFAGKNGRVVAVLAGHGRAASAQAIEIPRSRTWHGACM
jgi:hypothetical protein